ncbi:MAG: hypothetical protein EOM48_11245, partial [Bacilli bacterium]|nr:hypothetical protein [Bacilli bacterium]
MKKMISALYVRFGETVEGKPVKAKPTDEDFYKFLGYLATEGAEVKGVWEEAQGIVSKENKSDVDITEFLEMLDPRINKKLARQAVAATLRAMNIDIKKMMVNHFLNENEAYNSFSAVLRTQLENQVGKIDDADFKQIEKFVLSELDRRVELAIKSESERLMGIAQRIDNREKTKTSAETRKKDLHELTMVSMLGGLSNEVLSKKWKAKFEVAYFTDAMQQTIANATAQMARMQLNGATEYEIDEVFQNMIKDVMLDVKVDPMTKYKSLRQLNLLFQPITWQKNMISTNLIRPMYYASDMIQAKAEVKYNVPEHLRRFPGAVLDMKADGEIQRVVEKVATDAAMQTSMLKTAKYGVDASIESQMRVFNTELLERNRKTLRKVMSGDFNADDIPNETLRKLVNLLGDLPVYRVHFKTAMANRMAVLNYNEFMSDEAKQGVITDAMQVAEKVATERVFRSINVVSRQLLRLKRVHPVFNAVITVIDPFIITPIAVKGEFLKFSPMALALEAGKLLYKTVDARGVKNISAEDRAHFAEALPRAVVGTAGQAILGYFLGALGMMTGDWPENEREKAAWQLEGKRPFSIYIPGLGYMPIDWAQPVSTGFILGAVCQQRGTDIVGIGDAMLDSILADSMLEELDRGYGKYAWAAKVGNVVTDGIMQNFNRMVKTMADTIDPYERNVYQGTAQQVLLNRMLVSLPWTSYLVPAKVDVWGQPVTKVQTQGVVGGINRLAKGTLLPFMVSPEKM